MSDSIATTTFLPWIRHGVVNTVTQVDGDKAVSQRATIGVSVELKAQNLSGGTETSNIDKTVQLYGPGDISGVESKAIVRFEPLNWITNFEPNYLPFIEFYDEDFPWRYTPAAPDTAADRLRPWLMLVVLKEDEFVDGNRGTDKPLACIQVENARGKFPDPNQMWAWAHVHVNQGLMPDIVSTDDSVIDEFESVITRNPDLAYSRLVCPRRLEANTAYHAFLIPLFETGRLAGLGVDTQAALFATQNATVDYPGRSEPQSFPFYHRWYFRTGNVGDFEYLDTAQQLDLSSG